MSAPLTPTAVAACSMPWAGAFVVPSATPNACKGNNFDTYWTNHNHQYEPDVELRVYKTKTSGDYEVYDAGKHGAYPFKEYQEQTTAGTNVENFPGGPWVGIVLDYSK